MTSKLDQNKANAQAFYDLMFTESKPREAVESYAGDHYIQHNPEVGDGKDSLGPRTTTGSSEGPVPRQSVDEGSVSWTSRFQVVFRPTFTNPILM